MSLIKYKQKRNFNETPEPEGKVSPGGKALRFVVQKHDASQLHFDFRLEVDGVLKSWAVPKGPSLNPKDKRLAMMVEDHPLEYRTFEGTIPEGNYGAGTVMIWDEGTYHAITSGDRNVTEKMMKEELEAGNVKITLHGKKLKGEFALVKIKFDKSGKGNSWLLIKHDDDYANKKISDEDLSVVSGRSLDEIAEAGKEKVEVKASKKTKEILDSLPRKKMPHKLVPMLATLTDKSFDEKDWLFEIKWDGYRALAEIEDGEVQLYSRNNISFNNDYPDVVQELIKFPDMVLDGEVVCIDEKGRAEFQYLQKYRSTGVGNLRYYVFDILYYQGKDLRELPLIERKQILADLLPKSEIIQLSEHVEKTGLQFWKAAQAQDLEGIVAKRANSKYITGIRTEDWLKIKIQKQQEVVIGGYTKPKKGRKAFGALYTGVYEKKKLRYSGLVGTGFNDKVLKELKNKFDKYKSKESPFSNLESDPKLEQWLEPRFVAEVKFAGWTEDGYMRHPVFLGLREDKNPLDVTLESSQPSAISSEGRRQTADSQGPESKGRKPKSNTTNLSPETYLKHLDRVYWPKDKYTKGDLVDYYKEIAPIMLPYLKDRPQNLNRFPEGIDGPSFYHKDIEQELPEFVKTVDIYSESNDKEISYMVCNNMETLMYMANLGCLEINPWNSRTTNLDNPDYVLFDLDPNDTDFKDVVKVAQTLHEFFDELKVPNLCKTSGKDGLHVFVPLKPKYGFEQVQKFAELIALIIQSKVPDIVNLERKPDARKGKVYIDYLQNRKGQTTAGVYSPRPRDGAPVSTPLEWDEVTAKLNPKDYTIKNIFKRINKVGDLWKPMLTEGADLEKILKKLEKYPIN